MTSETERQGASAARADDSAEAADGRPPGVFSEQERFEAGASRYAEYLRTVEGRLRIDLALTNLRDALAEARAGVGRALDAGGGPGALSLRLAEDGWDVTVLDPSAAMLALAEGEARRHTALAGRVRFVRGDAAAADELFGAGAFDLVTCHNVVEYVADPAATAGALARVTRRGGLVSLLARNRAGEALRDALKFHDLDAARRALTAEWVRESLYGGPARLFDAEALRALAEGAGLRVVSARGVRVVADYLPPALASGDAAYARLLEFEHEAGARPEFAAVARYAQLIARAA